MNSTLLPDPLLAKRPAPPVLDQSLPRWREAMQHDVANFHRIGAANASARLQQTGSNLYRVLDFPKGPDFMYSPYDFNQSIAHRAEYVEERLKGGAPVVGLSYDKGILLFTVKRTQRKVFEVYDKLMYSAIGNQADVEAVRLAAIDFAHQEGFSRSPDDVSIQRLVGFAISPPLKRSFGDAYNTPNVLRALFAEIGHTPDTDSFFVLNYDGEFTTHTRFAVVAGNQAAEDAMTKKLEESSEIPDLATALTRVKEVWRLGILDAGRDDEDDDDKSDGRESSTRSSGEEVDPLQEALKHGHIEAGILERNTSRESKFRLLKPEEIN